MMILNQTNAISKQMKSKVPPHEFIGEGTIHTGRARHLYCALTQWAENSGALTPYERR